MEETGSSSSFPDDEAGNRRLHVFIFALGCEQLSQDHFDFMFAPRSPLRPSMIFGLGIRGGRH
jgi:hypothetical protein